MAYDSDPAAPDGVSFLTGGGEMGALMRAHDWSATALGNPQDWPPSLRAVVALMINSRYPMFVAWGPDLTFLYNDGYAPIFGAKHPHMLGRPFRDAWADIWNDISPLVDRALAGESIFHENLHLVMERNGYPEDTWYSFSYSPVRDDSGAVAGLFCACTETTKQVLADRETAAVQERQRQMLRQMPGFVGMMSGPDLIYTYVNEAYIAITERTDFVGRPFRDIFPDVEGQGYRELFEEVFHTGKGVVTRGMELRLHGRSEPQYVDFVLEPIRDDDGLVTGVFVGGYETTETYRGNQALRESEERFRNMADHAPSIVWVTDATGYCTYLNRRWYEFTGQTEEEAEGFGWLGATHPDDKADAERSFLDANEKQAPFRVEYRLRRVDGEYRWAIDAASPRFGEDGTYLGHVGSVVDIDDRKRAEEALRESEERLRLVLNSAPGGFYSVDREGNTDLVSRAFIDMMGFENESQALGRKLHGLIHHSHPDGRAYPVEECPIYRCATTGQSAHIVDELFFRLDGSAVPVEYWVAPIRSGGVHMGAICTIVDLTERKAAQDELRRSDKALQEKAAEFEAMAENIPALCWMANPDGSIFWYNRRWYEYTGTSAETQEGWGWETVHDPKVLPLVAKQWRHSLATGAPFEMTFPLRGVDGLFRPFLTRVVPILDGSGAIARWFGTNVDITDLRAAQDALSTLNRTLEQRVEERTAELIQAQEALRQSQKLEAMGQLTGGVAHDFNNLLTPIVGSLDLLQRRGLGDAREQRLIDGALQSAERARILVQRLLAFARRQPLQPSAVDIKELVAGMADLVASTSGPNIRLEVSLAPDLAPALADPNQLEMAILNLAVNARDAMRDGGTLTIAAANEDVEPGHRSALKPGRYVHLSVADNGAGMDEATLLRAVEPFFSTKGIGKGTGLGLSMVHGLASQLGGALAVSSKVGLGTTIDLWLPVSAAPLGETARMLSPLATTGTLGTVLLVDDEDLVRISTADMLADLGYAVVEANSAEAALAAIEDGLTIDLLITDHLMPGMTGADLARRVQEKWLGKSVLIVSGYADADDIAPDFPRLAKPFRQADLAASIAALTD